jgi:hypothetical protein
MQHEVATDRVVDVTLIGVDEVVGARRRRDESLDGYSARMDFVHMPDQPVALL